MAREFLRTMLSPAARAAQHHYYGKTYPDLGAAGTADPLGPDEVAFLQARDSFYLASVGADGWPYVQHRGGPRGFLVAPSPGELAFADHGGNRQLITVGNLAGDPRVCLFAVDYPARTRLKVLGRAEVLDARQHPELVAATAPPGGHPSPPERVVRIAVVGFDWNCPKFLTPRYTAGEVDLQTAPLRQRIAELEAELRRRTT
ncbi:MAG: pyridoxamine 5'-phosphate oxidase family protein [Planctomycetota bacterium]